MSNNNGLINKYTVTKTNGTQMDDGALMFVLRYDHENMQSINDIKHRRACRRAFYTYMENIDNLELKAHIMDQLTLTSLKIEKPVMINEVVDLLNLLCTLEPDLIQAAFTESIEVNQSIADHKSIQVRSMNEDGGGTPWYRMRLLGYLNGLFGSYGPEAGEKEGWGAIAMNTMGQESDFRITHFNLIGPAAEGRQFPMAEMLYGTRPQLHTLIGAHDVVRFIEGTTNMDNGILNWLFDYTLNPKVDDNSFIRNLPGGKDVMRLGFMEMMSLLFEFSWENWGVYREELDLMRLCTDHVRQDGDLDEQ